MRVYLRGSISGSGVLITPKGKRVVRVWGNNNPNDVLVLPTLIRSVVIIVATFQIL